MDSFAEKEYQLEQLMPLILKQLQSGGTVRFKPHGTSMLPMLREGIDSVVLSPLPEQLQKYDLPLYQRKNGQYVLHRIVGVGETYTCIGDNQFVYEPGVEHGQMIAVVSAFYRGEKRRDVRSVGHKLYCRVWNYSRPLRRFWRRGIGWLKRHLFKK